MDFDDGLFDCQQRIVDGDRGMSIGAGIEDDPIGFGPCLMQPVNDITLMITLVKDKFEVTTARMRKQHRFQLRQGGMAVSFRLAHAQEIEIRTVQNINES